MPNFIGFIDCTKIEITIPGGPGFNKRACYSGHKRFHCLIYQTITTPDGLIFHLFGPEAGKLLDITLYRQSGMYSILKQALNIYGQQYFIYGDPVYFLRPWLQIGFYRSFSNPASLLHNKHTSAVRVSVEHSYNDLKQMCSSQDYKQILKVSSSPIALIFKAAALL